MTPEKILDYGVKFGVVPFMFYMIVITRQDYLKTKEEVQSMQLLLIDCYRDQLQNKNVGKQTSEPVKLVAVLPDKQKLICLE